MMYVASNLNDSIPRRWTEVEISSHEARSRVIQEGARAVKLVCALPIEPCVPPLRSLLM